MVVEDMAVVATDIEYTLRELGYEVPRVVSSGEEAMQDVDELRPDLVLMDISLSGEVDGVEAAEWIREHLQIPVIYLTAYSDDSTLQRAKITEPFGYIVKPINRRELQANIEIALHRSKMEKALRESEERYAAVVQQSAECIFLVDAASGLILEGNPALQRLLGYSETEIRERTMFDIVAHERAQIEGHIQEIRARGSKFIGEERYCRKDGGLVDVEVAASLISYGGKEVICAVARDITERKRTEEALRAAEQELEAQRVLSVHSDRLRSLGEMAAGIAHELNQPLVGVRGMAEHILLSLERRWELSPEILRKRLAGIMEQADRMVHIIENVRLFSREAGKPDLSPVQVNEVVAASIDLLQEQFSTHGLELKCELAADLPPVLANPFSLEEVVLNLVNNARDAVEEQGGELPGWVRVHTGVADVAGEKEVRIEVEANGTGIPADLMDRVFEPFFTTKGPDRGTGLGLSISRSIVEQFEGRIELRSTPGEGTVVAICLPAGK